MKATNMTKEQFVKKAVEEKKAPVATPAPETKAPEVTPPATTPAAPAAPVIKVDMLIAKLPDVVRPKDLDALFGYDDGGKTVRRTLRAKFSQASGHEYKKDWEWKKSDPVLTAILGHFAGRTQKAAVSK